MPSTPAGIADLFLARGIRRLAVKSLSPNDNSKNQIYVGPGSEVLRILPPREMIANVAAGSASGKARPRKSAFYGLLEFAWLDNCGAYPAPDAKLVYYPQYPEVRFSGFLRGCSRPPRILAKRAEGRVLLLGVEPTGRILGVVGTEEDLSSLPGAVVGACGPLEIRVLDTTEAFHSEATPSDRRRANLEQAVLLVRSAGWSPGTKFSRGIRTAYGGRNAAGYTLEAILGVEANGRPEPDFEEWEIKAHRNSPVTVFTPEPDGGFWVTDGRTAFMRRYGYEDRKGRAGRINFGGVLRNGEVASLTGCMLVLGDTAIEVCGPQGEIAASWSFAKLLPHWNRKHDNVAYIDYEERALSHRVREYRFGREVMFGTTTEFQRFLDAVRVGKIYLDPAPKMTVGDDGRTVVKSRWQFRIKFRDLPVLYEEWASLKVQ
jgi:hypothetical protein